MPIDENGKYFDNTMIPDGKYTPEYVMKALGEDPEKEFHCDSHDFRDRLFSLFRDLDEVRQQEFISRHYDSLLAIGQIWEGVEPTIKDVYKILNFYYLRREVVFLMELGKGSD